MDGRIEPSRAAALAASLDADPEAAARLDAWRRQTDSLRTMFASVLSEPVPVRLLPVAMPPRCRPPARQPRARARARRPDGRVAGVVATTAIGAALVGFALGALACLGTDGFGLTPPVRARPHGRGRPACPPRRRAAGRRGARPGRLGSPRRTAPSCPSRRPPRRPGRRAAIGRRVGAGLRVPDLARQGWTFQGGHTMPGPRGPAAFLAYADGAGRLGLTVSRGDGGAPRLVAADDETSRLGVATWSDGEYGYALTTDRGRDWLARNLAPLRDRVRAQVRAGGEDPPTP